MVHVPLPSLMTPQGICMIYLWNIYGIYGLWVIGDFPAMVDDTRGYITQPWWITCAAACGEHTRMSGTCQGQVTRHGAKEGRFKRKPQGREMVDFYVDLKLRKKDIG